MSSDAGTKREEIPYFYSEDTSFFPIDLGFGAASYRSTRSAVLGGLTT